MRRESRVDLLTYLILIISAVIILLPIYWIGLMSIKSQFQLFTTSPFSFFRPTLRNYKYFFTGRIDFPLYLFNTIVVAITSSIVSVSLGSLAAYSISRSTFKWRRGLASWMIFLRMVPPVVLLVPYYMIAKILGLLDTRLILVIIYSTFNLPFATWLMKSFFDEIPPAMEEAAMIDGCSQFQAFIKIAIRLAYPGFAATTVFCLIYSWNEFIFALILTGYETKTVPVALAALFTDQVEHWGEIAAALITCMIPIMLFAILLQKHIARGITLGAVKG